MTKIDTDSDQYKKLETTMILFGGFYGLIIGLAIGVLITLAYYSSF